MKNATTARIVLTFEPLDCDVLRAQAEALAMELGLPILDISDVHTAGAEWCLFLTRARLELREIVKKRGATVYVDFTGGTAGRRRWKAGERKPALVRAVGQRGGCVSVLDATAGLARDAFQLASYGCNVQAVERSPVLAALVGDALERGQRAADPRVGATLARLKLVFGDARMIMRRMPAQDRPDVVYLDPMYPIRSNSALAKKEMRICRAIVGDDADSAELFEIAIKTASKRVVVKRHRHAPALGGEPDSCIGGRIVRYDVYRATAAECVDSEVDVLDD